MAVGAIALALAVLSPAALSGAGAAERPFKGDLAGHAGPVGDPTCPLGFRTVSEATGTASHLGLVTMRADHCFALPNLLTQGRMTLVAANGDELRVRYTGTCTPAIPVPGDLVTCTTDNVVVGGTGRFENASGELDITAHVLITAEPSWSATWTWEGVLGY
jgi:hypothetical protein